MNRIESSVAKMKAQIADRIRQKLTTKAKVRVACGELDMDFEEFVRFQELKSLAFADGRLTHEEAQYIYAHLGESPTVFNGQPVEVKMVFTEIFRILLQAEVK